MQSKMKETVVTPFHVLSLRSPETIFIQFLSEVLFCATENTK